MHNNLLKLANNYFQAFENKDLEKLGKLFDERVTLFDPVIKLVEGKEKVLEANQNIFNDCKNIKFIKKDIFVDETKMTVIGELEFYCDETRINVVDIIKFNDNLKIKSITAYLDTAIFTRIIK